MTTPIDFAPDILARYTGPLREAFIAYQHDTFLRILPCIECLTQRAIETKCDATWFQIGIRPGDAAMVTYAITSDQLLFVALHHAFADLANSTTRVSPRGSDLAAKLRDVIVEDFLSHGDDATLSVDTIHELRNTPAQTMKKPAAKPRDLKHQTAAEVHYRQIAEWLKQSGAYRGTEAGTYAMDDGNPFDMLSIDELRNAAFKLTLIDKGIDLVVPNMEITDMAHYPSPAPCPQCSGTAVTITTYAATDYANRDSIRTDVRCRKCGIMLRQRVRNQRTGQDVTEQHPKWTG